MAEAKSSASRFSTPSFSLQEPMPRIAGQACEETSG
jgi:hypothetical protein